MPAYLDKPLSAWTYDELLTEHAEWLRAGADPDLSKSPRGRIEAELTRRDAEDGLLDEFDDYCPHGYSARAGEPCAACESESF
jgi:hypothetical protein